MSLLIEDYCSSVVVHVFFLWTLSNGEGTHNEIAVYWQKVLGRLDPASPARRYCPDNVVSVLATGVYFYVVLLVCDPLRIHFGAQMRISLLCGNLLGCSGLEHLASIP